MDMTVPMRPNEETVVRRTPSVQKTEAEIMITIKFRILRMSEKNVSIFFILNRDFGLSSKHAFQKLAYRA